MSGLTTLRISFTLSHLEPPDGRPFFTVDVDVPAAFAKSRHYPESRIRQMIAARTGYHPNDITWTDVENIG